MARLITVDGPDKGKEFALEEPVATSLLGGRDPRHPIAILDTTVSREHFRIDRIRDGFRLVDLGSRNRTFLNGIPIRENMLRSGDVIAVGDSELRFEDEAESLDENSGVATTIIKEFRNSEGSSLAHLIDSLRDDPAIREERIGRAVDNLRQLFTLSREILRTTSIEGLYERLLEILVPALEADRGVIMHQRDGKWCPRSTFTNAPVDSEENFEFDDEAPTERERSKTDDDRTRRNTSSGIVVSVSVIQRVADDKKAILTTNAASDERFRQGHSIHDCEIATAMAAPILVPMPGGRTHVAGVLYVDRRQRRRPFDEDDFRLLTAAAEQSGEVVSHVESQAELRDSNRTLIRSIVESKPIVGNSTGIGRVNEFIRKAAPTPLTVLIRGETGTGKELVASAIHYQSPRQGKAFVAINCAAIPDNLVESELFGYEKGAFTGATSRKKGRFELANGGTIFLDELGELSLGCQAKLLRLIEEQQFERVGGTKSISVNVRIIAATNKDLHSAVAKGEFREDLFYRLNVLMVELPPLRERPGDALELARHFLTDLGFGSDKLTLAKDAELKLRDYHWPGNVRQLRNVIESAVVLGDGETVRAADLVFPEADGSETSSGWSWKPESLEEVQKRHIAKVLEHTGGNKKRAAEILGIERCTLYSKLKAFDIKVKTQ